MADIHKDPVAYYMDAAAAHRTHIAQHGKTPEQVRFHEEAAAEYELKAALAAAEHAFDDTIDWYALSNGITTVLPDGTVVRGPDEADPT